jgi:ribosomal protein S18 acetylase RimI-like enzyme
MTASELALRPCVAADAAVAVPLIHDSGPVAFRHVFSHADREQSLRFLAQAFGEGSGQFGYRNHLLAERAGQPVAICAVWDARANTHFTLRATRQIFGFYGARGVAVAWRGLRFERIVRPAVPGVAYIAHFTVAPECRGEGIGRALLGHLLARSREDGYTRAALDVADSNPRARALYEGMGFRLVATRRAALPERWGERVVDHHYLECALGSP